MTASASGWDGRTHRLRRPPIAQIHALAAQLRSQGRSLIDLGQAVLGLPPPSLAMHNVQHVAASHAPHVYSPDPGLPALREAIAQMCRDVKGISHATAEGVMVTCGANQAFANALLTVSRPGDEVLTLAPGYFDHSYVIALAECTEVPVNLELRDRRYCIPVDQVAAAVTPRTRCLVLVSPANPTAMVASRETVHALCQLCEERGLWLISDETYDQLVFHPAEHTSPARFLRDRVFVLGSFSKVFGLAGWRVGYMLGPTEAVEEAIKVQDALVVCAPVASQWAALGALEQRNEYVPAACQQLRLRRDALLEELAGWTLGRACLSDGATFAFVRLHPGIDDVAFCTTLLQQGGVIAVPGSAFGSQGAGHVRLSFGNQPVDVLRIGCERLRALRWP